VRTITDHKSLGWLGAWPSAGAVRVIGRNVGDTVQIYGPGITATRFVGGVQPMPSDMAIGQTTVTFDGVQAGTEIRVYKSDGTALVGIEDCAADQVLSWGVFGLTSANIIYITLLKRGYRWQRFNYTSVMGAQTLPIFQITDLGYSNPA